ncbi:hypothetical protein Cfla_3615 [Cellulomonas flavigena DSM 20109]|uniref:Uncharacterized protein n=1 Tax=Cellulomonas flavigena (strain ATCC 482 / DSM 20109 / BCRC 11376 / JCM 18109 / NBRC 3775 / NCIMB 8073 / NRS 134) TaxID=446466 RepID=D5UDN0_CELFN|nr:hypothetical protein [Cellulomonas flavigena]ADG76486.1 hypothetical protein Cfla_3615 [Cellulomonas flavigena DSM 20109]
MSIWEVDGIPLTLLKHVTLTAIVLVCWANAWRGPQDRPRRVAAGAIRHSAAAFVLAILLALVPGVRWGPETAQSTSRSSAGRTAAVKSSDPAADEAGMTRTCTL